MDPLTYYAGQSKVTDPGRRAGLLDGLPRDVAGLCRVVRGLVVHYRLPAALQPQRDCKRGPRGLRRQGPDNGFAVALAGVFARAVLGTQEGAFHGHKGLGEAAPTLEEIH